MKKMTEIQVSAIINPTENPNKVILAISYIVGDLEYVTEERDGGLQILGNTTGTQSLGLFRDIIARIRIRDASRSYFERIAQKDLLSFGLNKQAAYARAVSFHQAGDSPLGPIQVKIKGDIIEIRDYLCGKPPGLLF